MRVHSQGRSPPLSSWYIIGQASSSRQRPAYRVPPVARRGEGMCGQGAGSEERLRPTAVRINPLQPQLLVFAFLQSHQIHRELTPGAEPPPPRATLLVQSAGFIESGGLSSWEGCFNRLPYRWWGDTWVSPSGDLVWCGLPPRGVDPYPDWVGVGMPEAVELALRKIEDSLGELSAHRWQELWGGCFSQH